jgi:hypothetical protein
LWQEWCDKQQEFVLEHGKPEMTQAMKAGSERHAQLEQEVSPALQCWDLPSRMLPSHFSTLKCTEMIMPY